MPNRIRNPQRDRQADAALATHFHRDLVDLSPHMLWAARPDGAVDYFNARVFQYTGLSQSELEGWGWRGVVHPDDWERCLTRWTKAVAKGHPYEVEYRLRRRDGKFLWHLGAAMPQRDGERIVRWFGSCTEIESQKRAEKLLEKARESLQSLVQSGARAASVESGAQTPAETEERLRSIMSLWSDFYWESDAEHRITLLEAGGNSESFEFTPGRIGKTRWEIPSVQPDAEGWRRHREILDARQPFRDFEIARKDDAGAVRHFVVHGAPRFDDHRRFLGYRGVGHEITGRRLAERALRENNRQFRAFLESMPAIAWIKDHALRYQWVSASYTRVHGKSLELVRGRDDFEVWPEAQARVFRNDDELALLAKGPVQSIYPVPYADGVNTHWLVVKFPLPDASGRLGVAGIGFDMSEHARDGHEGVESEPLRRLSGRERQVLRMIVEGLTSSEVGERLGLSPKSVDTYRSRLMAKLEIDSLPALVKFALRHGLTSRR